MQENSLNDTLMTVQGRAQDYFRNALSDLLPLSADDSYAHTTRQYIDADPYYFYHKLSVQSKTECNSIISLISSIAQRAGPAIRRCPLLTEVDEINASSALKGMRAALRFREDGYPLH